MQKSGAGKQRHQRSILHRVPEPEPAPAEFVISPIRAHRYADGEKHPGCQRPWPNPARPSSIDAPFDQRSYRKRKRNRQPDITKVKQRWMDGQTDVLENRIKVTPLEWRL